MSTILKELGRLMQLAKVLDENDPLLNKVLNRMALLIGMSSKV